MEINKNSWHTVPGIPGLYITRRGVAGTKYNPKYGCLKICNVRTNHKGYRYIVYMRKSYFIHRLVALTFIPNPDNKAQINHKDGNKENNYISNLEWCSQSENMTHAYHKLVHDSQYEKRKVTIYQNGKFFKIAKSVREAARIVGGASTNISKCCSGERKQHNGFTFKYTDPILTH